MSVRGLMKRMSMGGNLHPELVEEDRLRWNMEREGLLQSQLQPGEVQLLPPPKSPLELGGPVSVPPMTAVRLTHSSRQYVFYNVNYRAQMLNFEGIDLFLQPFKGGHALPAISLQNSVAFQDAINITPAFSHGSLRSMLLLIDWEYVPADVDCIFVGTLSSANYLHPDQHFAASGLLELMDLEDLDPDFWCKNPASWPAWDNHKDRFEKSQMDMLNPHPSFFDERDVYATYLCEEETGFTKTYIWGRFDRVGNTIEWEFQPIRQSIMADRLPQHLPFVRRLMGSQNISLQRISGRTIHFSTQDPLATMEVQCYRFDRYGYLLGEPIIHNQVSSRGRLDLDLDASVIVDTLTRFWLVWSGSSEGFVSLQIDDEDPIDFMGDAPCIIGQFGCMGKSNSLFPTPKPNMWMFYSVFEKLDERLPLDIIRASQNRATTLVVELFDAKDLVISRPIVRLKQGTNQTKAKSSGEPPAWNTEWVWGFNETWREAENRNIIFEIFSKNLLASAPAGMAIYELDTMRIPFRGELRLRPTGPHATKKAGGVINVRIDIQADE